MGDGGYPLTHYGTGGFLLRQTTQAQECFEPDFLGDTHKHTRFLVLERSAFVFPISSGVLFSGDHRTFFHDRVTAHSHRWTTGAFRNGRFSSPAGQGPVP